MSRHFPNLKREITQDFHVHKPGITTAVLGAEQAGAELAATKHKYEVGVRSTPVLVESPRLFLGTLAVIGVGELGGEAMTFASGSDNIFMAALAALTVTATTVGGGSGIGFLWPYTKLKNLADDPKRCARNRAWSWPLILVLFVCVAGVAIGAGCFKEAATTKDTVALKDIAEQASNHLGDFSLSTFVMFAIAMVACGATAFKVANSRDPEPKFAASFKRMQAAKITRDGQEQGMRGLVSARGAVAVEGVVTAAKAELSMLLDLRRQQKQLNLEADRVKKLDAVERAGAEAALKQAHVLNIRVRERGDGVVPEAYKTDPDLSSVVPKLTLSDLSPRIEAAIARQTAKLTEIESQVTEARDYVHYVKAETARYMLLTAKTPVRAPSSEAGEYEALFGLAPGVPQITSKKETANA